MIKKQNVWYAFLFSIILVLSIIYVNLNEDTIYTLNDSINENFDDSLVVINESTELVALRVKSDEELEEQINKYKDILLSETSTIDEKNEAYDSLLSLNDNKGVEEKIEELIKKTYKLESFTKILGSNITVVINKKDHSYEIANDIMNTIQKEFKDDKYITVRFN